MDSEAIYQLLQSNLELFQSLNWQYEQNQKMMNRIIELEHLLDEAEKDKVILDSILIDYEDIIQMVLDGKI